MGLMAQRSGTIRFLGEEISPLKPFEIARRGMGYVPEDRRIFPTSRCWRTSTSAAAAAARSRRPRCRWTPERLFAIFPILADDADRRGAT